jgi:hypothetical protein
MALWFTRKKLRNAYLKLVRQSGTPKSIARGAAIGLFIGLAVPVGFQTPFAIALAFLFRAGKLTAWLFTLVSNPYTVPFIYPVLCYIGSGAMGRHLTFSHINNIFREFYADLSLSAFFELSIEILLPLTIGGIIVGTISAIAGYYAVYGMVLRYQTRVKSNLLKKLSKGATRTVPAEKQLNIHLDG